MNLIYFKLVSITVRISGFVKRSQNSPKTMILFNQKKKYNSRVGAIKHSNSNI